jgi:hypothetical protein
MRRTPTGDAGALPEQRPEIKVGRHGGRREWFWMWMIPDQGVNMRFARFNVLIAGDALFASGVVLIILLLLIIGVRALAHQPRERHSGMEGRSLPRVVSFPWPG